MVSNISFNFFKDNNNKAAKKNTASSKSGSFFEKYFEKIKETRKAAGSKTTPKTTAKDSAKTSSKANPAKAENKPQKTAGKIIKDMLGKYLQKIETYNQTIENIKSEYIQKTEKPKTENLGKNKQKLTYSDGSYTIKTKEDDTTYSETFSSKGRKMKTVEEGEDYRTVKRFNNINGNDCKISVDMTYKDGSFVSINYEYTPQGEISKEITKSHDPNPENSYHCYTKTVDYDRDNNNVKQTTKYADGESYIKNYNSIDNYKEGIPSFEKLEMKTDKGERITTYTEYDTAGRTTKETTQTLKADGTKEVRNDEYKYKGNSDNYCEYTTSTDYFENGSRKNTIIFHHNEKDEIDSGNFIYYRPDGKTIESETENKYDYLDRIKYSATKTYNAYDNGYTIKEEHPQYNGKSKEYHFKTSNEISYDDNGTKTYEVNTQYDLLKNKIKETSKKYNSFGTQAQETTIRVFKDDLLQSVEKLDEKGKRTYFNNNFKIDGLFTTNYQGEVGNCYFLSPLNALNQSSAGKNILKSCISETQDKKGQKAYQVRFAGAELMRKEFEKENKNAQIRLQGTYTVTMDEIITNAKGKYSKGDLDYAVMETAYKKMKQDLKTDLINYFGNKNTSVENHYIVKALTNEDPEDGGFGHEPLFMLTGKKSNTYKPIVGALMTINPNNTMEAAYKPKYNDGLGFDYRNYTSYENNVTFNNINNIIYNNSKISTSNVNSSLIERDRLINKLIKEHKNGHIAATTAFFVGDKNKNYKSYGGHEYAIADINEKEVTIINPWYNNEEIKIPMDVFKYSISDLTICEI